MKTHQEGTMENTTSNSNVDHINFLPHPQPDRRESGSDQSYSDNTVTRDVITELGRVLEEMNHTKRAFSRRHKPDIPKFPAKDMTLDVFFIKLMSYIEIMEIAGGRDLHNLLVQCLEGDALKLYMYVADGEQIDLKTLKTILFRHFEKRKHDDIHMTELMTVKKTVGETISQYFLRIKELSRGLNVDSNMQIYAFKQGLPYDFRKYIATKKIETLRNLFEECITYEQIKTLGPTSEDWGLGHIQSEGKILASLDKLSHRLARIEAKGKIQTDKRN